jgi:hypothetical protein
MSHNVRHCLAGHTLQGRFDVGGCRWNVVNGCLELQPVLAGRRLPTMDQVPDRRTQCTPLRDGTEPSYQPAHLRLTLFDDCADLDQSCRHVTLGGGGAADRGNVHS